jgi:hypothetical protein
MALTARRFLVASLVRHSVPTQEMATAPPRAGGHLFSLRYLSFSSVRPRNCRDYTLKLATVTSSHIRSRSSFTNSSTIQENITQAIERASLNEPRCDQQCSQSVQQTQKHCHQSPIYYKCRNTVTSSTYIINTETLLPVPHT